MAAKRKLTHMQRAFAAAAAHRAAALAAIAAQKAAMA